MTPLASIIIITKDQRRYLKRSLPILFSQTIKNIEVILVDSSERENNHDLFKIYPVKRVEINPKTFNYAAAFNTGAKKAKGDFLVRLSVDAVPKDIYWLEKLLENFKNKNVGGVYSRWVTDKTYGIIDLFIVLVAMRNKKIIFTKTPNWNGASGAIRKILWKRYPFDERLAFCEDWDWSKKILKKWLHHSLRTTIYCLPLPQRHLMACFAAKHKNNPSIMQDLLTIIFHKSPLLS